ncbi:HD domain-containing protein [Chitinophaga ginsengisegetis]|uniref:HD domain-containing protein n=1 Tax=Chitinophaga ginsengisegetis TaxID=393003 RepID=A0A1T5NCK7_9BACT|nr:HD domain-containing protein [Chitinophaga ginsengisegetis]SKC98124.1 HD domain-containing protein [Chitinophaga ginsengisegetis]
MYSNKTDLLGEIEGYISSLLNRGLAAPVSFHTIAHTRTVVTAVTEIGAASGLTPAQLELVQIAAWFHDAGYCYTYIGHEEESKKIARQYLTQHGMPDAAIQQVLACIEATKMPQHPLTLMEEVLCDADLYHLSQDNYQEEEALLREEWAGCLFRCFTDEEWNRMNDAFLIRHQYFTDYGRRVLQERKEMWLKKRDNRQADI